MKVCPVCGNAVENNKTYCSFCGTSLQPQPDFPKINDESSSNSVTQIYHETETTVLDDPDAPAVNQPQFEQPQYEQPQFEQPQYEQPQYEQPQYEQPQYEQPQFEQPQFGQSQYEQQQYDQQKFGQQQYGQPNQNQTQYEGAQFDQTNYGTYSQQYQQSYSNTKTTNKGLIITISVLAFILLVMCGYGVYALLNDDKTENPGDDGTSPQALTELTLVNGTQAYVVSRLKLRTEPTQSNPYNVKTVLPVGTVLNVINVDGVWSKVEVIGPSFAGYTGWVATRYIVSAQDYALLNSIFASPVAREALKESYLQYALLQYYHKNKYVGRMSDLQLNAAGLSDFTRTDDNQWQVEVTTMPPMRPSEVTMQKLINPTATLPDLAVIIKNISNGDRRLLYFTFDNNENATLYRDLPVPPHGRIQQINKKANGDLDVYLTEI